LVRQRESASTDRRTPKTFPIPGVRKPRLRFGVRQFLLPLLIEMQNESEEPPPASIDKRSDTFLERVMGSLGLVEKR